MKKLILLLLLPVWVTTLCAQVSYGGRPVYEPQSVANKPVCAETMPAVPCRAAAETNGNAGNKQGAPLKFGHLFNVNFTPDNSGEWSTEAGMMIWRLRIQSSGAKSINITFDRYAMTPNASLFVFNPACEMVLGAFTDENNKASGVLPVSPIQGDEIIVELQLKEPFTQKPELKIGAVNHGYLDVFASPELHSGNFGDSDNCHEEATCNSLLNLQRRSVCRLIVSNQLCSGALINNTANDGTPYFLTAAHCITNESDAARAIFLFNYESPKCEATIEGYKNQSVSGSYLRAFVKEMDFALLEIDGEIPSAYRPYWSGWSRRTTPDTSVENPAVAIHHPNGDVKKMAYSESPLQKGTFTVHGQTFMSDSHWKTSRWSSGATEGGSSGCPLFYGGYIIGGLSGGSASCSYPAGNDYFFRFNKAWDHYPNDPQKQLACWLDPASTNATEWEGIDFYGNEFVRLSNLTDTDSAVLTPLNTGSGTWSGHNSLKTESIVEHFNQIESAQIHGVYLVTAQSKRLSNQTVHLNVRTGASLPGTLVASKEIAMRELAAGKENLIMLNTPVDTSQPVWIELALQYAENRVDTFALFQSKPSALRNKNSAWIKNSDGEWMAFDKTSDNTKASYWMDILARNVVLTDSASQPQMPLPFNIYPNPASDRLTIEYGTTGTGSVELFNLAGQCVLSRQISVWGGKSTLNIQTLNIQTLNAGIYILRFSMQDESFTRRIVKL